MTQAQGSKQLPRVSLVMPVLNEAATLERAFDAIDRQTYPRECLEILVVDGGSSDATLDIVNRRMEGDPRIRLLGGPSMNTPLAMNIGIEEATGELIAKIDGHGWMNEPFIELAERVLADNPNVGCVGGQITPIAETEVERANAYARFSRFGVGSGTYTAPKELHVTDTVQCGVYRRSALDQSGLFDPDLAYGEDEELNYRLTRSGWEILFHPGMIFSYRVRPSLGALFRQYFRYGRARVAVVRKHPAFFRPKHAAPGLLVSGLVVSAAIAMLTRFRAAAMLWAIYLSLLVSGAAWLAVQHRFARPHLIAAALAALHTGYGLGSLAGLWRLISELLTGSANGRQERLERLGSARTQGQSVTHKSQPE
jgi:glycosyltransferase involved in cell wall biosynthesis